MKFDDSIIEHLSERGFVTRKSWGGRMVLFFGMDNMPWLATKYHRSVVPKGGSPYRHEQWVPCLADFKADDWIILPYHWDGSKDDYLPFEKKDPRLKALRDLESVVRRALAPRKTRAIKKGRKKC
jgi:hypothetical protein